MSRPYLAARPGTQNHRLPPAPTRGMRAACERQGAGRRDTERHHHPTKAQTPPNRAHHQARTPANRPHQQTAHTTKRERQSAHPVSAPSPRAPRSSRATKRRAARGGAWLPRPITVAPHHPTKAQTPNRPHHQKRKHHSEHNSSANTQTPTTHRANTPTTGATPPARTPITPTPKARGHDSVSAKQWGSTPARAKQAKPPQGRARRTAHKERANNPWFAPVRRLRPQGEDSAREGRTRLAHACRRGLSVFVGVFADVCRRFWVDRFGCLGVFWGCLVCFLVF